MAAAFSGLPESSQDLVFAQYDPNDSLDHTFAPRAGIGNGAMYDQGYPVKVLAPLSAVCDSQLSTLAGHAGN